MLDAVDLSWDLNERRTFDMFGDFYGIFKATELLEVAFSRDSCSNEEYSVHCSKLIGNFKDTEAALLSSGKIKSTEEFLKQYNVTGSFCLTFLYELSTEIYLECFYVYVLVCISS